MAFSYLGVEWKNCVGTDLEFVRPVDDKPLLADPTRAKRSLGWKPKVGFEKLIEMMAKAILKSCVDGSQAIYRFLSLCLLFGLPI